MKRVLWILILLPFLGVQAQDIPLGTWRTHFSYTDIRSLTETPNTIFAAADVGLFTVELDGSAIRRFSALDGFQDESANVVLFDQATQTLLIGYASGNLDLIQDSEIINIDLTTDSQVIGSKAINDILVEGEFAYIATDYGILKFDILRAEVRETYREIGEEASQIGVNKLALNSDSLVAATTEGIQASDIDGNLADFREWRRYEEFNREVESLEFANDRLYALDFANVLFEYTGMSWVILNPVTANEPERLASSEDGLFLLSDKVELMDATGVIIERIEGEELMDVSDALKDRNGQTWIADHITGLWAQQGGDLITFSPSGPIRSIPFHLEYTGADLYALPGGYSPTFQPQGNDFGYTTFDQEGWENFDTVLEDVVDAQQFNGEVFLASAGDGLINLASGMIIDNTNSPLDTEEIITDIESDGDFLYVLNPGAFQPLHTLDPTGVWQSFSFPTFSGFPTSMEVSSGRVWMVIPLSRGGGIYAFNTRDQSGRFLSETSDQGGLASRDVGDVALDKEGFLWIGTSRGISVWFTPFRLEGAINATEPIFEGRPLLVDQRVYSIAVDGGNRKWIGTDDGAWLFDEFADELILHFTASNSPLPSNEVREIEINPETGEVFFLTDVGMVSYRADATESDGAHSDVKIFPNPVEPGFQGSVGISGLATDANVKVTDSAGRLVFETQANGGTATWPVRQNPGGPVRSGVYFVFSVAANGDETFVGKVAVIE